MALQVSSAAAHQAHLRASLLGFLEVELPQAHQQRLGSAAACSANPVKMRRSHRHLEALAVQQAEQHLRRPLSLLVAQLVGVSYRHSSRILANKVRQHPRPQPRPPRPRRPFSLQRLPLALLPVLVYSAAANLLKTLADRYSDRSQLEARKLAQGCLVDKLRQVLAASKAHLSSAQSQRRRPLHPRLACSVVRPQQSP